MNYECITLNARRILKDYVKNAGLKSLVLGISGGIDSAVVAALARPVCDELDIPLIGRSLPILDNKDDEIERARKIGSCFCHDFQEFDLWNEYQQVGDTLTGDVEHPDYAEHDVKIRRGNIKARLRMIFLYDIAQEHKGMVLGTDNLTELFLGFWTLHGDVGDFGMIQNLWKTDVYELAKYLCKELDNQEKNSIALYDCIIAVPTDGLGISNSDLDQLGAKDYGEVTMILKTWLTTDIDSFDWDDWLQWEGRPEHYEDFKNYRESLKFHPVVKRYERTHFKRNNPTNISFYDLILWGE